MATGVTSAQREDYKRVTDPTPIGIIGCGDIIDAYVLGLSRLDGALALRRCADLLPERAEAAARRYGITRWGSVDDLLADDEVQVVISLTPPKVHDQVIADCVAVGKHVFTEKPLALSTERAERALRSAAEAGVSVGCAPDTFLGSASQTARSVLDGGRIGRPTACVAFSPYSRAERRHPNPSFLFAEGAGPLMDMGPYFIAGLINLFGPIGTLAALSTTSAPVRTVLRADGATERVDVEVPTHATALLRFESGMICTFVASFDIWDHELPSIEVYGTEGMLSLPHPNWYDGDVRIKLHDGPWETVPPVLPTIQAGRREKVRGLGVIDLLAALDGAPHRANARLGLHTLEVLESMASPSATEAWTKLTTTCPRPEGRTLEDPPRPLAGMPSVASEGATRPGPPRGGRSTS